MAKHSGSTRAVVFHSPNRLAVMATPVAPMSDEDVLVETTYSWISPGTEMSYLRGERAGGDTPWKKGEKLPFPIVPGYQKVGKIIDMGSKVTGFAIGQTVFATLGRIVGMFDAFGGHIGLAPTHQHQVFSLPDGIPPIEFSGMVLAQVGWNCGTRPGVKKGDLAWILGDGLVGLWTAQALQSRGARVRLIGRHVSRLSKLKLNDGDQVEELPRGKAVESLAGEDPSIFVDTVGDINAVRNMTGRLLVGGHLVCAGYYPDSDALGIRLARAREITVHTPAGWSRDRMLQTRDAIRDGVLDTASVITHCLAVEQAVDAYALVADHSSAALGVVLKW